MSPHSTTLNTVEALNAETPAGRQALDTVMQHSYHADVDSVPARWARVRLVEGAPVSFILIDPERQLDYAGGSLPYAFICDVATRSDRQGEGHFRAIMEDAFAQLHAEGLYLVITHGRYPLYRRFGFDVFTHHCGITITPEGIERHLGRPDRTEGEALLTLEELSFLQEDLLLISDVRADTLAQARAALLSAAACARERGKSRILFEHPAAPSYGSRYPIHPSIETPFSQLARACGAEMCLQGADPESGVIPDADWIKVLDTAALMEAAVEGLGQIESPLPRTAICFDNEAGRVTLESTGHELRVLQQAGQCVEVHWPAAALAQLVTGYVTARMLCNLSALPEEAIALLEQLFPRRWRFSRNESWVFSQ